MRFGFCLMGLLFLSCMTDINPSYENTDMSTSVEQEMWICYNTDSNLHGKPCSDECYEEGNPHKFCWYLDFNECNEDMLDSITRKACMEYGSR